MYGGPHGPGPGGPHHGPGPGGPHHGPYGPHHGPHGFYGPHYGPMGPRFYGPVKKDNKIDYMKSLDYEGEGKKYYSSCACENCTSPFAIDYRIPRDVIFVSRSNIGFKNGHFYSDEKFKGVFMFKIGCPECSETTVFFVETRRLPKYVLDQYLKETKTVKYTINYKFGRFNANIDVSYNTNGTNVKEVYENINSLQVQNLVTSKENIPVNIDIVNEAVLEECLKQTNKENKIYMESLEKYNKKEEISKLKQLKYILLNNGIKELIDYKNKDINTKEEIKILSR